MTVSLESMVSQKGHAKGDKIQTMVLSEYQLIKYKDHARVDSIDNRLFSLYFTFHFSSLLTNWQLNGVKKD
jgi:hypothetical protein